MVSKSVSVVTTNDYDVVVTSEMSQKEWFHAVVVNTGDTNELKYKVVGRVVKSGSDVVIVEEATVAAEASAEVKVGPAKWYEIDIVVKSSVEDSPTTCRVEYIDG